MIKAYKCALIDEQINGALNLIEGNGNMVEVQLLSVNDDLSKIKKFGRKVCSIHLPIEKENRTCNLSTILKAMYEKNEQYNFIWEVAKYANLENAGIVIHTDITIKEMIKSNGYKEFIDFLKVSKARILLENTPELDSGENSIIMPLVISSKLCKETELNNIKPLLDVCHYQITHNEFDSMLKINLEETLQMYSHNGMYIHLCSSIGDSWTHGVHGSNFKENPELLEKILKATESFNPHYVLETCEKDFVKKENAVWLNNKIDEIFEEGLWNYKKY